MEGIREGRKKRKTDDRRRGRGVRRRGGSQGERERELMRSDEVREKERWRWMNR